MRQPIVNSMIAGALGIVLLGACSIDPAPAANLGTPTEMGGAGGSLRESVLKKEPEKRAAFPQEISCRVNRLTDIVFPGKILKVVMSDSRPHDFKLVWTKVGFETHLIVEPLKKGADSDFFIYGTDRVSYLKLKTVPDGEEYDFRFEVKGNRKVSIP